MKKIYSIFFLLLLLSYITIYSQPVISFDFESHIGNYTEITGGTLVFQGSEQDFSNTAFVPNSTISELTTTQGFPIGFDFDFNDLSMNQFAIGSQGYVMLGKDGITIDPSDYTDMLSDFSEGRHNVIGISYFGYTVSAVENTEIRYQLLNTNPNRVLVIQFKNLGFSDSGTPFAVNYQIKLYESTGNIEMVFDSWLPNSSINRFGRIGIKGSMSGDLHFRGSSFNNSVKSTSTMGLSTNNYPADGLTYTFIPPANCETPSAQPSALVLTPSSINIEGSFNESETADHYLIVMTETETLSQNPVNGTYYSSGDIIGNGNVIAYTTENNFKTSNDLSSSTSYYFHIFAVNSFCFNGPQYLTSNPLNGSTSTNPALPTAIEVVETNFDSMALSMEANEDDDMVIVAMTTEVALNTSNQKIEGGTFGVPEGELNVGDELEGGGKIVYKGAASGSITVDGLDENTVYYFRAWSYRDTDNYSSTYINAADITWSYLPYKSDFDQMPWYNPPIGWEAEGSSIRLSNSGMLQINPSANYEGAVSYVTTQWIQLAERSNRISFEYVITEYVNRGTYPYNTFGEGEYIELQLTKDGVNYEAFYRIDENNNMPYFETTTSYVQLNEQFELYAGELVKFRIHWHTVNAPTMTLDNIQIEQTPECDYPVNLQVDEESLVGNQALLSWDARAEESRWGIRYRIVGEDWEPVIEVDENPYLLALPPNSLIEVQVRAHCSLSSQSEWSESIRLITGYELPFTETFDSNEMPNGWTKETGEIGDPTSFYSDEGWFYYARNWKVEDNHLLLDMMDINNSDNMLKLPMTDWVITPKLDFGDGSVNYQLEFDIKVENPDNDTPDEDIHIAAVISSDDGETFSTEGILKEWKVSDGTYTEILDNEQHITVNLGEYSGIVRIGFYVYSSVESTQQVIIDNVAITETCPIDIEPVIEDITSTSVKITWEGDVDEWLVFVREAGETSKNFTAQADAEVELDNLVPRTEYEVGIAIDCDENDRSRTVIVRFTALAEEACEEVSGIEVEVTQYTATITWEGVAMKYNVRFREAGSQVWTTTRETNTNSITIDGLTDNSSYEYSIQSVCSNADGDESGWTSTATFTTLAISCFAPENVEATGVTHQSVTITWEGNATDYEINYRTGSNDWESITVTGAKEYTLTELEFNTSYSLRVRGLCNENDISLWSATITFRTESEPVCVLPYNLQATGISESGADLSWSTDVSNLSWNIRYREGSSTSWTTVDNLQENIYQLTGLTPNTAYLWSVKASCDEGRESSWASQESFTTLDGSGIHTYNKDALQVMASGNILNIINPENIFINRVQLFATEGKLLGEYIINSIDNILIPVSASQEVLLVKIFGKESISTYKVIVK